MRTDDFDYDLPEELIAQAPAEPRDSCRLLVLHRDEPLATTGDVVPLDAGGCVEHRHFYDIIDYLEPGDLLVANETRVMPARLIGRKAKTGGMAETLLLTRREDQDSLGHVWECLVSPGKRLKPGAVIEYRAGGPHAPESAPVVLVGEVLDFVPDSRGGRLVRFTPQGENASGAPRTLDEAIHAAGHVPLPPYITDYEGDPEKYQTVYAMSVYMSCTSMPSITKRAVISAWFTPTSTPFTAVNIHAFAGLFTRATTRGTAYSIFASIDVTRFVSSNPVTAATASAMRTPARSKTSGSEPLPSITEMFGHI